MKNCRPVFYLFVLLVCFPIQTSARSLDDDVARLQEIAETTKSWLPYLRKHEQFVTGITLSMIVLGAVATFTALSKNGKSKWVTAGIAATITILTGVKSQILHADEESYGGIAVAIERYHVDVEEHIREYQNLIKAATLLGTTMSEEEQDRISGYFAKDIVDINKIGDRATKFKIVILRNQNATASLFRLPSFPTAYAATEQYSPVQAVNSYSATGTGSCNSTAGAREYARYDGRRRIALKLEPNASGVRLDGLIDAIDGSVQDRWGNLNVDPKSKFVTQTVQVTLNKALTDSRYLKVAARGRPESRYTTMRSIQPGFDGPLEIGSAREQTGIDGAFLFGFRVRYVGNSFQLQLDNIKTYSDSSAGSTRWAFDVLADNKVVLGIPLRRFDDGGKPTVCTILPDENLKGSATISNQRPVQLKVVGYKPKDF